MSHRFTSFFSQLTSLTHLLYGVAYFFLIIGIYFISLDPVFSSLDKESSRFIQNRPYPKFWNPDKFMDVNELKPGDTGYGITVFSGTKRERFGVEIINIGKNYSPAFASKMSPKIFAKLNHPRLKEIGSIAGMSGSPVYINEKLIGAISHGMPFNRDGTATIQPIKEMLYLLEQQNNETTSKDTNSMQRVFKPLHIDNKMQLKKIMHPNQGLLKSALSGKKNNLSKKTRTHSNSLQKDREHSLKPGDCIGIGFILGDLESISAGTLSYKEGNQVLMFGHSTVDAEIIKTPHLDAPMVTCSIQDVRRSYALSSKYAQFTGVVGTISYQNLFGVKGELNKTARMIPFTIRYQIEGTTHSFNFKLAPVTLTNPFRFIINCIAESWKQLNLIYSLPKDIHIQLKALLEIENKLNKKIDTIPVIRYTNSEIDNDWLSNIGAIFTNVINNIETNPFTKTKVNRMALDLNIAPKLKTLTIAKLTPLKSKIKKGDSLPILVEFIDHKTNQTYEMTIPVDIPQTVGSSRITLTIGEKSIISPPVVHTYAQLIKALQQQGKETKNKLAIQIQETQKSIISLHGIENPALPASMISMLSRQNQLVLKKFVETREILDSDYLIVGNQSIHVNLID